MTKRSYFGKMNSTLGSVVPLAIFCGFQTFEYLGQWWLKYTEVQSQHMAFEQSPSSKDSYQLLDLYRQYASQFVFHSSPSSYFCHMRGSVVSFQNSRSFSYIICKSFVASTKWPLRGKWSYHIFYRSKISQYIHSSAFVCVWTHALTWTSNWIWSSGNHMSHETRFSVDRNSKGNHR